MINEAMASYPTIAAQQAALREARENAARRPGRVLSAAAGDG